MKCLTVTAKKIIPRDIAVIPVGANHLDVSENPINPIPAITSAREVLIIANAVLSLANSVRLRASSVRNCSSERLLIC